MGQPARISVMLEKKIASCCIENTNCLLKELMNKKEIKQVEKRFFAKTSSWNPFQAYQLEMRIFYSCNTKYDKGKHTACFSLRSKRKCSSLSWNKGTKNILSTAAAKYFVHTKPLDTRNKQFCHIITFPVLLQISRRTCHKIPSGFKNSAMTIACYLQKTNVMPWQAHTAAPSKPSKTENENRAYPLIPPNSYYIFNMQKAFPSLTFDRHVLKGCSKIFFSMLVIEESLTYTGQLPWHNTKNVRRSSQNYPVAW